MSGKPLWKNATGGRYVGTYFKHDMYIVGRGDPFSVSIVGQFGDHPADYASGPVCVLFDSFLHNTKIGVDGESVDYQDYVFSSRCSKFTRASILAVVALFRESLETRLLPDAGP